MPATMIDSAIFGSLWSQHTIKALFDDVARTRAWLEIVAVLAEVQAEFTLIPAPAAHAIALRCRELAIDAAFLEEMPRIETLFHTKKEQ